MGLTIPDSILLQADEVITDAVVAPRDRQCPLQSDFDSTLETPLMAEAR
jgi:hypothetical protein